MYIAPGVTDADWFSLNLDEEDSEDWIKAIDILRNRICSRYFDAARLLIDDDNERDCTQRKYGFTILAICCLLMETFQAFKDGLEDTAGKSKVTIVKFLMNSPSFSKHYPNKATAEAFYKDYRCGILHQAEIGGNSLVWSVGSLKGEIGGSQRYVNRTEIYESLKKDFDEYLEDISDKNKIEERKKIRKKMDFIARKQTTVS